MASVDFLLECIGFPPDQDLDDLARLANARGERVALRGPTGDHYRLCLGHGLELRMDREHAREPWSLLPFFDASQRLRVAVRDLWPLPDSRSDYFVAGSANPPAARSSAPAAAGPAPEEFALSAMITDARRLPAKLERGHVLAIALAGFALDVQSVELGGEPAPATEPRPRARIAPLGGASSPGGCVEVSLRVLSISECTNPITGAPVQRLELDAPGRALPVFVSSWQLEADGLSAPAPGALIEGTFLLTGRIAGGIDGPSRRAGRHFG